MKRLVILVFLCLAAFSDESRPYQGYDDLGEMTPERGISLEHPGTNYGLFMIQARSVFNPTNQMVVVKRSSVLTLNDFSRIENGMVEVLVHSFSETGETSETNYFRVTLRRPSRSPKVRMINLTPHTNRLTAPVFPPIPFPNSGSLPVSTTNAQAEGRVKMREFYNRPPRRGTNAPVAIK